MPSLDNDRWSIDEIWVQEKNRKKEKEKKTSSVCDSFVPHVRITWKCALYCSDGVMEAEKGYVSSYRNI